MYKIDKYKLSKDGYPMTIDDMLICDETEDYVVLCEETKKDVPLKAIVSFKYLLKEVEIELPSYRIIGSNGASENLQLAAKNVLKEYERPILAFTGYLGL